MTSSGPAAAAASAAQDEVFAIEDLRAFAARVFSALGMPPDDVDLLVDHLLWAEVRGQSGLGLRMVPQYVARLQAGGTRPSGELAVVAEVGSLVVLDAGDMFAHVVGVRALDLAVTRARSSGVGLALVRNTTSAGALGYYAALATLRGMIGLAINNTPPVMAPWGGRGKDLGSQAFAIGSPAGSGPPLVFDTANATLSWSPLHDHERRGEDLPEGAVLDAEGRPTVDARAALAGIALPIAGHRGSGLALMWEVLTGVLAGGQRFAADVGMPDDHARPQGVSLLLLAIGPEVALPYPSFVERVDRLVALVQAIPSAPGVDRIRVPGERSQARAQECQRRGVPLPAELVAMLRQVGADLGVRGI